ncbi:MAG: DNA repair protein RecO [Candidatus Taylorbacteria bacterium]|nr:DNA repair protein RecO [Candidatus Taylorbacteria bacterium]
MSHHIYTTPGFVVGSRNSGEANKYFYIFTRELGMVGASAQGVRLIQSKLRYHTQDFSYSNFSLVRGRDVWRMTSVSNGSELCEKLKEHKKVFVLYTTILALLKRLLHGEEKHEDLFDAVRDGFIFLTTTKSKEETLRLFECLMLLRILHLLGYIGKTKELEDFLSSEWNESLVIGVEKYKTKIVGEINRALKESQL